MREILFRGKRVCNGYWLLGGFHSRFGRAFIIGCSKSFRIDGMNVIPETVGQFTGLTDKNGKKIFDGDILDVMHRGIFECRWDEGNFEFGLSNNKESFGIAYVSPNDIFVIGNIHDNPELLEDRQ